MSGRDYFWEIIWSYSSKLQSQIFCSTRRRVLLRKYFRLRCTKTLKIINFERSHISQISFTHYLDFLFNPSLTKSIVNHDRVIALFIFVKKMVYRRNPMMHENSSAFSALLEK